MAIEDDGSCIVMGCVDSRNPNYDPLATDDDGSCMFLIPGCMNPTAINYRASAQLDDGSCIVYIKGCMDAVNFFDFDPLATFPDMSQCNIPRVNGCMDTAAVSYMSIANTHVASMCVYPPVISDSFFAIPGCMNPLASNYIASANTPGPCSLAGCMQASSIAYNPDANFDDGSCYLAVEGCTNSLADNYWEIATHSRPDSCSIGGCMVANDPNYDPTATYNDGSCATAVGQGRRLQSAAAPPPPPPAPTCTNYAGFVSSSNIGCNDYAVSTLCANGGYGPSWSSSYGTFADWANADGVHAGIACCVCGGARMG